MAAMSCAPLRTPKLVSTQRTKLNASHLRAVEKVPPPVGQKRASPTTSQALETVDRVSNLEEMLRQS
jgi:hypothetical protein